MTIEAGQDLLHYRLIEKLGEGGMGVVWKAIDTTLDREVAIKVLPQTLGDDTERLVRFEREAKLLASLNHPNIAAIYALETAPSGKAGTEAGHYKGDARAGTEAGHYKGDAEAGEDEGDSTIKFLAMELVGGEDLSERLTRGPIPIDEATQIARSIAQALEVAHERGIIHRDLKPANVRITEEDEVKVLDFGLAKAFDPVAASGSGADQQRISLSLSPTLTAASTMPGIILGTAAYMAPEQARGKPVDRRADVWAFGCVLYEMLTAKRLFQGETVSDLLAEVLKTEVDWDRLPPETPRSLRRLLRRCLTRDPSQRLRDLGDARLELDEPGEAPLATATVTEGSSEIPTWRRWLPWGVAAGALAIAAIGFLRPTTDETAIPAQPVSFQIDIGSRDLTTGDTAFNFSPDGQTLAFATNVGTTTQVYLRRLDEFEPTILQGTEDGHAPFFSYDAQWIGFFSNNKMLKVPVIGGSAQEIANLAHAPGGADWGEDDTIIFATAFAVGEGLSRVAASGGPVEPLTVPNRDAGEGYHHWPQRLPGGTHVLFSISDSRHEQAAILDLESREWSTLPQVIGRAHYVASGHLVYGDSDTLLAVPFDLDTLQITGRPFAVLEGLQVLFGGGAGASVQVSPTGNLAYLGAVSPQQTLVWADRDGQITPLTLERGKFHWPQLSRDGTKLAVSDFRGYAMSIHNLARGGRIDIENGIYAVWGPGDEEIFFTSTRTGVPQAFRQRSDASSGAEQILERPFNNIVNSISPNGRYLLYYEQHPETSRDIWVLDLEDKGEPEPLLVAPANERSAKFSPDGKWYAFTSNRSGRDEVYLRQFEPRGETDHLVSTNGGREATWGPDGREIFYRAGRALLAVSVQLEPTVEVGRPEVLFEGDWALDPGGLNQMYDVSPDGQRFLMIQNEDNLGLINIVVNWTPGPL